MEREITLNSFSVKGKSGNHPGDFTTRFNPTLDLPNDTGQYYLAFNRIISMAFTWTNINSGYANQKIAFSKDGRTFTDIDFDIDFAQGVWDYKDIDNYIREKTKTTDSEGKEVFPITLTFDEPTFRVLITLQKDYQLDLTKSNFHRLIGFKKVVLSNERNGTSNGSSKGRQGQKANVKGRTQRRKEAQDVNTLINNLIARS